MWRIADELRLIVLRGIGRGRRLGRRMRQALTDWWKRLKNRFKALDKKIELFFAFVIAAATVVNLCVAVRQWAAMVENNGIASRALTAVQRAFITVSELKQEPKFDKDGKVIAWRFTPVIKNTGNTDAEMVTFAAASPMQEWIARPQNILITTFLSISAKIGAPRGSR
jgi:hypothetical protein